MHNLNITNNAKCFLNKYTNTWHLKGERTGMENEWRSHNCPDVYVKAGRTAYILLHRTAAESEIESE
jgi:hypothetical protein